MAEDARNRAAVEAIEATREHLAVLCRAPARSKIRRIEEVVATLGPPRLAEHYLPAR
jgi:hypothetical protein